MDKRASGRGSTLPIVALISVMSVMSNDFLKVIYVRRVLDDINDPFNICDIIDDCDVHEVQTVFVSGFNLLLMTMFWTMSAMSVMSMPYDRRVSTVT
jgi:hypothetical protein